MSRFESPILVANWKANLSPGEEVLLAGEIARDALRRKARPGSLVIAPSTLGLVPVASLLQREHGSARIEVAAQDVSGIGPGPFTGEVPASHLVGIASAVIVGHSERRALGETDALVGTKVARAVAAGLTPIVCVGDRAREATTDQRCAEVREQWSKVIESAERGGCDLSSLLDAGALVAYEPLWAIGSGASADPAIAWSVAASLRAASSEHLQVLYGGSVRAAHAGAFFVAAGTSSLDGLLVGGASLSSHDLLEIAVALGTAT